MLKKLFRFLRPVSGMTDSTKKFDRSYNLFMSEVRHWYWNYLEIQRDMKALPYEKENHDVR